MQERGRAVITIEDVLSRLEKVKKNGDGHKALCPAHDDSNPSLSIKQDGDKILLNCFAGCKTEDVVKAMGLTMQDLMPNRTKSDREIVATYDYTDEGGTLLYQKVRYSNKTFAFRVPNGTGWNYKLNGQRRVLFQLPDIIKEAIVFIAEGEKDCLTLKQHGFTATTNDAGASRNGQKPKWDKSYNEFFRDRIVYLLPDNDSPGRAHVENIFNELRGIAGQVRIVELPGLAEHEDVSDWFARGGTVEEFQKLCIAAPENRLPDGWDFSPNEERLPTTQKRILKRRSFSDILPMETGWLIPEVLPKGVVVSLISQEGDGKSTLAGFISAFVSRGGQWSTGGHVQQGDVVIFSHEESPECSIAPRLIANGADMRRVHLGESVVEVNGEETEFDIERDIAVLDDWADELPNLQLVIFDPITSYVSCSENSNAEVRRALKPLIDFAERRGVTVLALTHLSKKVDLGMINRTLGSRAWSSVPRMIWGLQVEQVEDEDGHKVDTGNRFLLCVKCNLGRKPQGLKFSIEDGGKVVFGTERIDRHIDDQGGIEPSKANAVSDWLKERIGLDVIPASEITAEGCRKWNIGKTRLSTIATDAGITKRFSTAENCWVWSVKR